MSGSRLKATHHVGSDGSRFARPEVFDSVLGFQCRFLRAIDGTTRCFPASFGQVYYADASCSVALAAMLECAIGSERHVYQLDHASDDRCPSRFHRAYAMSAEPSAFDVVHISSGGECLKIQAAGTYVLHELTEIPADDLARVDVVVDGT